MGYDVFADFSKVDGTIRALHGVNNGPVCYGSLTDVSKYYKELGVPWVRIHDSNWPHPREVDYYTIFPDFEKDADDPGSYDFRQTDTYIKSIADIGARIVYRLGVSIEHTQTKYHVQPPESFDKWADICVHIIRHYNEGWADGFHYGILHWEIWNEPESIPDVSPEKNLMWSGTHEQYFELYRTASVKIRQACPDVKIGGFAYTYVQPAFLDRFLAFVSENSLPLDFFSWHTYASNPMTMAEHSKEMKRKLDQYGFRDTEIHCNEYNYAHPLPQGMGVFGADNQAGTEMFFEALKNEQGASFDAAVLILLQDCPVDVLNYYDAAPSSFWSFFNCYGVPQKAYYAFLAFKEVHDKGNRVATTVTGGTDGLYCLGAIDDNGSEAALMLTNFDAEEREYSVGFRLPQGKSRSSMEVRSIDADHSYDGIGTYAVESDGVLKLVLKRHTVLLMKLNMQP